MNPVLYMNIWITKIIGWTVGKPANAIWLHNFPSGEMKKLQNWLYLRVRDIKSRNSDLFFFFSWNLLILWLKKVQKFIPHSVNLSNPFMRRFCRHVWRVVNRRPLVMLFVGSFFFFCSFIYRFFFKI